MRKKADALIFKTPQFEAWLKVLPIKNRVSILARFDLITLGHWGDYKLLEGLIEFRWRNGIRVYAFQPELDKIVILLGGNKNGQSRDISKAQSIRNKISEDVLAAT